MVIHQKRIQMCCQDHHLFQFLIIVQEIKDLKLEAEDVIDITEAKTTNFLPAQVKFHEVEQTLENKPINK